MYSKKATECFHFDGIELPEAVFYCSVEPPNAGATARLERVLAEIVVEDPSFRVRQDGETGQTIVETMGEVGYLNLCLLRKTFIVACRSSEIPIKERLQIGRFHGPITGKVLKQNFTHFCFIDQLPRND